MDEKVLAIKRKTLFGENDERAFSGFVPAKDFALEGEKMNNAIFLYRKVAKEGQMKPAEEDEEYKQLIAYLILTHNKKIFCYKRTVKAGEQRLRDKYSLGIGGHINPIDSGKESNLLTESMEREFNEEIEYSGGKEIKLLGYINDDLGAVERVHFGVVFEVKLNNSNAKLREKELDEGVFLTLEEIQKKYENLESWGKITFDYLKKN
jgi:predicted NUDIX family phosphoesterase